MKDMIEQVLANKSLTVFLGIVVVALLLGWVGG
jgi:plastocyanin domain-containing protein